jgi:hypothetical protein
MRNLQKNTPFVSMHLNIIRLKEKRARPQLLDKQLIEKIWDGILDEANT